MLVLLSRSGRMARLLTPACAFSCFHSSCLPLPHAFQGWTRLPPGPLTGSTHWLPGMDPPSSGPTHLPLNHFVRMSTYALRTLACATGLNCLCRKQLFFVALTPTPTSHTSLTSLGANNVLILSLGLSGRPRRREGVLFLSNPKCLSWTYAQV